MYLHPVVSTVGDRLTRRGVFRGAVFSPASLAHRMDLPGDLVNYCSVAFPTPDGRSTVGVMANDREKVACAALLTFGSAMLLEGSTEQGMRLDDWETVMEGVCAEGAGASRWQLLARTVIIVRDRRPLARPNKYFGRVPQGNQNGHSTSHLLDYLLATST